MAVAVHRQRDRRMPGQLLRDFRMHARRSQQRDERMPERVKVGLLTFRVLGLEEVAVGSSVEFVGDGIDFLELRGAGFDQVSAEHLGCLLGPCSGPEQFVRRRLTLDCRLRRASGQPNRQPIHDERMQRQFGTASRFLILGGNRDRRRLGLEVECRQSERRQFVRPQSRHRGQQVQRGAVRTGQRAERRVAVLGRVDQSCEFVGGHRPPFNADIDFRVESRQVGEWVPFQPLRLQQPVAERLHGDEMMIAGRDAKRLYNLTALLKNVACAAMLVPPGTIPLFKFNHVLHSSQHCNRSSQPKDLLSGCCSRLS